MEILNLSALLLFIQDDDVLYSPNKYRETEGIKDQQNSIKTISAAWWWRQDENTVNR